MPKKGYVHLLIPKEFRVYCKPNDVPDKLDVTTESSKCTCVNCLNVWRHKKTGKWGHYSTRHVRRQAPDYKDYDPD